MRNKINPLELKGRDKVNRMKDLMGIGSLKESTIDRCAVELTKNGPDGKIYAIVREGHLYHIKISNKKENVVVEDFQYIGGLKNKHKSGYKSYADALKQMNLSFISISEALGRTSQINAFINDNLVVENFEVTETEENNFEEELSETEKAIDAMVKGEEIETVSENFLQNNRLKISKAVGMVSEDETGKAQLVQLINTLTESEKEALIKALKKKA